MESPDKTVEINPIEDVFLTIEKWPKAAFQPHYHDAFNWLVPLSAGHMTVELPGRSLQIHSNSWICVLPNVPHAVSHVSDGMEVLSLFLNHEEMFEAYTQASIRIDSTKQYILGGQGSIAQGLAIQWADFKYLDSEKKLPLLALFRPFVCRWLWSFYDAAQAENIEALLTTKLGEAGDKTLRFLARNIRQSPFPWEVLTEELGISQRTYQRTLAEKLGQTPSELLASFRIQNARELLKNPNLDVTEIALLCGYSSQSHFSTAFKAQTGFSPKQYRLSLI